MNTLEHSGANLGGRINRRQRTQQRGLPGVRIRRVPALGAGAEMIRQLHFLQRSKLRPSRQHLLDLRVSDHGSAP
jgi:hypothetical protein